MKLRVKRVTGYTLKYSLIWMRLSHGYKTTWICPYNGVLNKGKAMEDRLPLFTQEEYNTIDSIYDRMMLLVSTRMDEIRELKHEIDDIVSSCCEATGYDFRKEVFDLYKEYINE